MTWQILSTSSAATESLASKIGQVLKGGEVIELVSDLGGGKTTFVRGLARGMGSSGHVSSPTFTISQEYQAGKLTLKHFDFYRLHEAGVIEHELAESLGQSDSVIVIEWPAVIKHVLPTDRLTVVIKQTGENTRQLLFSCSNKLEYLLKGIK